MKVVRDHRGRELPRLVPYDALPYEVLKNLQSTREGKRYSQGEDSMYYWPTGWMSIIAVPILLVAVLLVALGGIAEGRWIMLLVLAGVLLLFEVLILLMRPRWLRSMGALVARMCADAAICAGCGYTLHELRPAEDGCVVCPECGAAWRLVR
jgi:hypothetical protein